MAFWKKKKETSMEGEELPPLPDMSEGDMSSEELPPLPPLPGEEDITAPEPMPRYPKMRPAAPVFPEVSMPAMRAPSWTPSPSPMSGDKTTVFVRIDKYRDIMKMIDTLQAKVSDLNATLEKISAVKQREGEIVDGWHAMLQDAKGKLDEISSKITKPEA